MPRTKQWIHTKLGSVAAFTNGGAWSASEYVHSGIPVVRVTDCQNGTVDVSACKYLSEADYAKYRKHQLSEGDLVVATVGSHPSQPGSVVGRPIVIPREANGALLNQNAVCIRPVENSGLDRRFLAHFAKVPSFGEYIIACARGSANQVRMAIGLLREMPIELPPLAMQKRIADILSAYDDLIENNTHRIKILEEMAQSIYREWFVNFRFPGHKKAKFVDSPLGKIPQGWEVRPIGDAIETTGGGTPSTKDSTFWEGGHIIWFSPSDLTASGTMFISEGAKKITATGLERSSAKMFPPYCVMMTSRATIGVVAMNTCEACTNQGFITCIPNERLSAYHVYFWILENKELITSIASGATYKEISRSEFRALPIAVPDTRIGDAYAKLMVPVGRQIEVLQRKNSNLRQTRDMLLPKLISGEVEV